MLPATRDLEEHDPGAASDRHLVAAFPTPKLLHLSEAPHEELAASGDGKVVVCAAADRGDWAGEGGEGGNCHGQRGAFHWPLRQRELAAVAAPEAVARPVRAERNRVVDSTVNLDALRNAFYELRPESVLVITL